MKSGFRFWAYLPIILFLIFLIVLFQITINFDETFTGFGGGIWVCFCICNALFLLFTELRTKIILVNIDKGIVRIKRFLGLGKETEFRFIDLDGFHTSTLRGKGRYYDYIYLMQNGRKVAKISNQYHSNYDELLDFFENNLTDLGHIDSDLISELKDSIKF